MDLREEMIRQNEGCRLIAYPDLSGNATIGWGHKLSPGSTIRSLTQDEADELLARDVAFVESVIQHNVRVPLNENQTAALCDFIFNAGPGAFCASTLLRLLNQGKYDLAGEQFMEWNKEKMDGELKTSIGLSIRRLWEKEVWQTPVGKPIPARPTSVNLTPA